MTRAQMLSTLCMSREYLDGVSRHIDVTISALKAKPPVDTARALLVEWLDLDFFDQNKKDFRQRVKAFIDAGEPK